MELNTQPIEKRVRSFPGTYEVHSIFRTIQGEGPFSGTPCVFIRLAGCNLQCPWCDTDYTSNRMDWTPKAILATVKALWNHNRWRQPGLVVITGGEPFRQDLEALFEVLVSEGFYVQVETNGTLEPSNSPYYSKSPDYKRGVYVVCSPKTGKVHPRVSEIACAFKYVLSHDSIDRYDGLPVLALGHTASPIVARPPIPLEQTKVYVQPMDAQDQYVNQLNIEAAREMCMEFGYTLQLQIHKLIGAE